MATVEQKLIRDFTMLLQTRGTRLAARGADGNTDAFRLYTVAAGDTVTKTVASSEAVFLMIEFDKDKLTALSQDKAYGAEGLIIPSPDRV
jgi:hypothetical protein